MKRVINHSKDWKLTKNIKTGLSVPEDYFTGIEDELFSRLIVEKLPKHDGFKTPEAYFESLENVIIEKTKKKNGKLTNFKRRNIKLISVAASIVLLLFFGSNFIYNTNTELSSEEIISWLDMNANSLSNDEIAFALTELNVNDINPYLTIKNEDIIESLLDSNEVDYLIEE